MVEASPVPICLWMSFVNEMTRVFLLHQLMPLFWKTVAGQLQDLETLPHESVLWRVVEACVHLKSCHVPDACLWTTSMVQPRVLRVLRHAGGIHFQAGSIMAVSGPEIFGGRQAEEAAEKKLLVAPARADSYLDYADWACSLERATESDPEERTLRVRRFGAENMAAEQELHHHQSSLLDHEVCEQLTIDDIQCRRRISSAVVQWISNRPCAPLLRIVLRGSAHGGVWSLAMELCAEADRRCRLIWLVKSLVQLCRQRIEVLPLPLSVVHERIHGCDSTLDRASAPRVTRRVIWSSSS